MPRIDGRSNDQLRPVFIELGVQRYAEGSALISTGDTRALCAVSVENEVPKFLKGSGRGWVTAEYSMLPRATLTRSKRESTPRGRTQEIQRLIGRSLRAAVDMAALGEITLTADCDVIQADGGTRTASITGAYVALYQALLTLKERGDLAHMPIRAGVAATSVGIVDGEAMLDLRYAEDYKASVDFNVVMTDRFEFIEAQGTAEDGSFDRAKLNEMLDLAERGIRQLVDIQRLTIARMIP